mgnify:FL=1
MVVDVSPQCDCHAENDAAIIPNVGMFASFDPVALDMACVDAVNAQTPIANSQLGEHIKSCGCGHDHDHEDYFKAVGPDTNWRSAIDHAEKIGLGTSQYELITI